MKQYLHLFLLAFSFVLAAPATVHAGFWSKKNTAVVASQSTISPSPVLLTQDQPAQKHFSAFSKIKALMHPSGKKEGSGWEGILAIVCGGMSFLALFASYLLPGVGLVLLCIPAIIFGILGINKKNNGLAIAGLVLGGVTLLILLLAFVALANMQ
jgi:hypothetical protein